MYDCMIEEKSAITTEEEETGKSIHTVKQDII